MEAPASPPSGRIVCVERKRGPAWYAKYRLPDGRQVQKKLGRATDARSPSLPLSSACNRR